MVENDVLNESRKAKCIGITLIGTYVFLRMIADAFFWRNISVYYSYIFETIFVVAGYALLRKTISGQKTFGQQILLWKAPTHKDLATFILTFFSGLIVYLAADWVQVPIPFDFASYETIILLLILAPILEELIFRMVLWQSFQLWFNNNWVTIIATTLLFAAGHFAAYWFVPEQFHGFVIYQSSYVIFLGAIAGWRRLQSGAVSTAVLVHMAFNFGFFCASAS